MPAARPRSRPVTGQPAERCDAVPWPDNGAGVAGVFVRELWGGRPGPTLLVCAGEHGVELSAVGALDAFCRDLAGTAFRGTLLALPCLAPANVRHRTHTYGEPCGLTAARIPTYDTTANWPGRATGSPAQRLCHRLWREVVSRADVVLNFHAWPNSAGCLSTDAAVPGALALARHYGSVFNIVHDPSPGLLHTAVLRTGRPAAIIETHGQYRIEPDAMARVQQGLRNVMAGLDMLPGPLVLPPAAFALGREHRLTAPHAGLFVPLQPLEQLTRPGDCLGYLLDVETGARTPIVAPVAGAVWLNARHGPGADLVLQGLHAYAAPGDLLALIKEVRPL